MKRSTYWMMDTVYIYAQLLGIFNFCYDCRKGTAQVKGHVTAYCAIVNVIMFAVLAYFFLNMEIKSRPPGSAELHYKLNLLTAAVRIGGVIVTVFFNWTKRKDFVELINSYQTFCKQFLQKFQMEGKYVKYLEYGIRIKLKRSFIADILCFILAVQNLHDIFDMENPLILMPLALIPTVLNVVMTLYYFAILNFNVLLLIINDEVERILNTASHICQTESVNGVSPAALMNRCCLLADELDELAVAQYKIKDYLKRINSIYDIQGVCIMLDLYVHNIYVLYMCSMLSEHVEIWNAYGAWVVYIVPVIFFVYYFDLKLFVFAMLNTVDLVKKTGELLKERQAWLPRTDERLERSLNNFSLQLTSFPLVFDLVGLYKMNRPMTFAIFSSTLSNAIVLMQYDLKYTKRN